MNRRTITLALLLGLLVSTIALAQTPEAMSKTMKLMKQFQQQVAGEKFDKAADTIQQLIPLAESVLGKNSPVLIRMEINRGTILRDLGRFDEAKTQLAEALQHAKTRLGSRHGIAGTALNALGSVHRLSGEFDEAGKAYQQAIAILNPAGEAFAGDRIDAYSNYGDLLSGSGQATEALRYTKLAFDLSNRKFGEGNPRTAILLNNLGMQQRSLGNLPEAEKTMRQSVALYTKIYDPNHQEVASSLQNLALVLTERGKYDEAVKGYNKAISILQKKLGPDHPTTLTAKGNLGQLYTELGDSKQALPLLTEVLEQRTKTLGAKHPSTATTQRNLGVLKIDLSEYDAATELLETSLATLRETQSSRLGDAAVVQSYLGLINGFQGEVQAAVKRLGDAAQTANDAAWQELPAINSNEQGRFLISKYNPAMFVSLSLGFQFPENPTVIDATAEWSGNSKGIAAEALAVARQSKQLKKKQPKLRWVTLDEIRNQIADDGVWIDITRHDFIDFKGKNYKQRLQDPQYVAWIVPKEGKVSRVELGNAAEIDKVVDALRDVIKSATGEKGTLQKLGEVDATREAKEALAAVADRVWKPLEAKLPEATKTIHLSPDGALWLLPWNALPIDDKFLVQRYAVTTFVSGRNFVTKDAQPPKERTASAVFANPRFDQTVSEKRAAYTAVFREPPPPPSALPTLRAFDASQSQAAPLPGTELEARAILPSMTTWLDGAEPVSYAGSYALESIAKQVVSPKSLVFATHGFFTDNDTRTFDPLKRCGLLLAGCNDGDSVAGNDDGVLTGVEIADLNLQGTELVVLSACETGVGRIENGNGVAGIRRAFHLAGARSVASTLWQVPDFDTAKLMGDFFAELAKGKSKGEALRQAQIRRIESRENRNGAAHPFFWAGFSVSGR